MFETTPLQIQVGLIVNYRNVTCTHKPSTGMSYKSPCRAAASTKPEKEA